MKQKRLPRAIPLCPTKPFPSQSWEIKAVSKGAKVAMPVIYGDGSRTGWARYVAPTDGYLINLGEESAFVSAAELRAVLAAGWP